MSLIPFRGEELSRRWALNTHHSFYNMKDHVNLGHLSLLTPYDS